MKEQILKLKTLRDKIELLKNKKRIAYEKYMAENNSLFSELENVSEQMINTEMEIREIALTKYKETGEKKLNYGVGIRILKKLEYNDKEALKWAKEHNMALSLDKKSFDKIAKAEPMDFVKINEVPQATLPSIIDVD